MVKRSSLLHKFVNYGQKKFYNIWPRTSSSDDVGSKIIRRYSRKNVRSNVDIDDDVVVDKKKRMVRFLDDPDQSDTDSDEPKFFFNRSDQNLRKTSPSFDSEKRSGSRPEMDEIVPEMQVSKS